VTTDPPEPTDDQLLNAVAVTSQAHQLHLVLLQRACAHAAERGLPVSDIARAGGLDCEQAAALIHEGSN